MGLKSERGTGLVEFALLAPIVLFMVLGIVDYSRFMYYRQALTAGARAGADMAMNHCPVRSSCGMTDAPVGDDYVLQATYCAAAPTVVLRPAASTCASCITATCTSPCDTTCQSSLCQTDICVNPLAGSRTNGQDVTVSVGYKFKPFAPLVNLFFPTQACWPGDPSSNQHTLCASYTASVY